MSKLSIISLISCAIAIPSAMAPTGIKKALLIFPVMFIPIRA